MLRFFTTCVVLCASSGAAQEAAPLPQRFLDQALRVDVDNQLTEGQAQKPLSHRELFVRLGREDLVARSDERVARRRWLLVGAVGLTSAAAVVGTVLLATSPNLASIACESDVRIYNEVCVPQVRLHTIAGTATIAAGVMTGLVLAGLAFAADPAVLSADETATLVGKYNAELARRLRGGPSSLRVLPVLTPDGAALAASFRF